jgi:hypothetical protein
MKNVRTNLKAYDIVDHRRQSPEPVEVALSHFVRRLISIFPANNVN